MYVVPPRAPSLSARSATFADRQCVGSQGQDSSRAQRQSRSGQVYIDARFESTAQSGLLVLQDNRHEAADGVVCQLLCLAFNLNYANPPKHRGTRYKETPQVGPRLASCIRKGTHTKSGKDKGQSRLLAGTHGVRSVKARRIRNFLDG